jgi:hypothetical protein
MTTLQCHTLSQQNVAADPSSHTECIVLGISISGKVLTDISWHPSTCPDSFLYTMFTHRLPFTYFPNRSFVISLISDTTQAQRVLKDYLNKTLKAKEKDEEGEEEGKCRRGCVVRGATFIKEVANKVFTALNARRLCPCSPV